MCMDSNRSDLGMRLNQVCRFDIHIEARLEEPSGGFVLPLLGADLALRRSSLPGTGHTMQLYRVAYDQITMHDMASSCDVS
jgi:hypothetical protein